MALSGSISGSIKSGKYKLRIDWSATQSVANNTSKITAVMYLVQASGWSLSISGRTDNTASIAGTSYSWSSPAISSSGGKTTKLATVTSGNIAHNADGTKSVTISAKFNIRATISGTYYESITASATVTLNTIPRATTPTVSSGSVNMGSAVTINTPRASSAFTHDLAYSFAGASYVAIATGVGTSYNWTTPDLASKIPNTTSGTVTIRCITKNGSTTIGTKTVIMTLKVPTSVVPTITAVTVEEDTDHLAAQFGAFIKGKSTVTANITARGAKGSTIKSYSTTFNGKTYTGAGWTSSVVTSSGSLSMVTTVTDSRGRTAKKTTTITVLDYAAPAVNTLQVYRVNDEGGADRDGVYIAVRYKYGVTSLNNKNKASLVVEYKRSTATEWSSLLTGSALSADTTALPESPTFSTDYQYDVRLTVTDWFGEKDSYTTQLQSGAVILDILANGKGISFGKTCEREGVEIGWATLSSGGFMPIVLPDGTDLNTVATPNTYAGRSIGDAGYTNTPTTSGTFTLEVLPAGDAGQLFQRFIYCSKTAPAVYLRFYYQGAWGDWIAV